MVAMLAGTAMADDYVIDFNSMDLPVSYSKTDTEEASSAGDIAEATTLWDATNKVSIVISPAVEGNKTPNRFWRTNNGPQLRMYSGTFVISGAEMKTITFDATSNFNITADNGTLDGKTWTGEATSVTFTVSKNTQINKITISSEAGTTPDPDPDPDPDPEPDVVEATCAEIIAGTDGTVYKVKGVCTEIKNTTYGNWMLTDETGEVYIYGTLDANGQTKNFASLGIEVGDTITVQGPKTTYNETVELKDVTVLAIAKKQGGDDPDPDPDPEIAKITVNTALQLIAELEDSKTTDQEYQVEGYVTAIDEISAQYGNATFDIADAQGGTPVLKVYRAKNAVGEKITDENLLKVGDIVVVQGKLQKYVKNEVTTPELASGGKILTVNGAPTGITEISTSRLQKDVIYNLRGQRVSVAKNGLYIINGKKVFVK